MEKSAGQPKTDSHTGTSLRDLFRDQLRDAYSVECQLVPALIELASMATSETLRQQLQRHAEHTREQKERLEQIGRTHGWELSGDRSKAMAGLIDGGRSHIASIEPSLARDFLIVAHTHRIEHYEIAAYAINLALAGKLALTKAARLLETSMKEEQEMDSALTRLADEELLPSIPRQ